MRSLTLLLLVCALLTLFFVAYTKKNPMVIYALKEQKRFQFGCPAGNADATFSPLSPGSESQHPCQIIEELHELKEIQEPYDGCHDDRSNVQGLHEIPSPIGPSGVAE